MVDLLVYTNHRMGDIYICIITLKSKPKPKSKSKTYHYQYQQILVSSIINTRTTIVSLVLTTIVIHVCKSWSPVL